MHSGPTTPLPDDLIGVWRRVSLSIVGGAASEDSRVVWIQGRTLFADVRSPLEGASADVAPMSFAGHTSWEEPRIRFHRTIDLNEPVEDAGTLSWRGADLVESGQLEWGGRAIAFEEVWRRTPPEGDTLLALEAQSEDRSGETHALSGVLVRLGSHAIAITDRRRSGGDYCAAYLIHRGGRWLPQWSVGDVAQLPRPPAASETLREGDAVELPMDVPSFVTRWRVRECGVAPDHSASR